MSSIRPRLVVATLSFVAPAAAVAQTWDGGGINDNWGTLANWNPNAVPPSSFSTHLTFAGTTRLTPFINASWNVGSITFAPGAGAFVIGGGPLTCVGPITNNDNDLQTLNVTAGSTLSGAWNAAAGPLRISGSLSNVSGGTLLVTGAFDTTFEGALTSSGMLNKGGTGTLRLSGTVNTPQTIVDGGTVLLLADQRLTGYLVVNPGAVFDVQSFTQSVPSAYLNGGTLRGGGRIDAATGVTTEGGTIECGLGGAGGVIAMPSATASILRSPAGANSYGYGISPGSAAAFVANQATLWLQADEQIPDASDVEVVGGGTLKVWTMETIDELRGAGLVQVGGGHLRVGASGSSFTMSNTVEGVFPGLQFTKVGAGTLTLAGTVTTSSGYSGPFRIASGVVTLAADERLTDMFGEIQAGGTLRLNGHTETLDGVFGAGVVELDGGTLKLDAYQGGGYGAPIDVSIRGPGSVVVLPGNGLRFTGANTYTGPTIVQGNLINANTSSFASTSEIRLEGGILWFDSPTALSRPITVDYVSGGEIRNYAPTTIAGHVGAALYPGVLEKRGPAALTLASSMELEALHVIEGDLRLGPNASAELNSLVISPNCHVRIDGGVVHSQTSAAAVDNSGELELMNDPQLTLHSSAHLRNAGLLWGEGRVDGRLLNEAAGEVSVAYGERLDFTGANHTNAGLLSLVDGTLHFADTLTNQANGLIAGAASSTWTRF